MMTMGVVMRVLVRTAVIMAMRTSRVRQVSVNQSTARGGGLIQFFLQPLNDRIEPDVLSKIREHEGAITAHLARVAVHDFERGAHVGCEVNFVNHQKVGAHDAWAALSGDFVAFGYVDDINPNVHEL